MRGVRVKPRIRVKPRFKPRATVKDRIRVRQSSCAPRLLRGSIIAP